MGDQSDKATGGVLMLGSIPLADAKAVFTRTSDILSERVHTIPDGETGERHYFCRWQHHVFPLEVLVKRWDLPECEEPLKKNYTVDSLNSTGYDDAALASYAEFVELRRQGIIASGVRFQVCVPTPFAVTMDLCKQQVVAQMERLYEQRLISSIKRIIDNIPHNDLVIQWDLPFETLVIEYDRGSFTFPPLKVHFEPVLEGLLERLARINRIIPVDVNIALHLCYGDSGHKHIFEPKDTALMVNLTHHLIRTLGDSHHIEWVHMPVPINRTDVEYFQPLGELHLQEGTRLCLGLVHAHDEVGTRKRIQVAKSIYPHPFSVATECGLGRTPQEDIDSIFEILKNVTEPIR